MTTLTHLECPLCQTRFPPAPASTTCRCGAPLLPCYDLERARKSWSRDWIKNAPPTLWRYAPVLPASRPSALVSLGEGMTPLVRASRLSSRLGLRELWIKDESLNPTGSLKARDMACAVSMAREHGIRQLTAACSANDALALAAYAAAAGVEATLYVSRRTAETVTDGCRAHGARIVLLDSDPARPAPSPLSQPSEELRDLTVWQEPYRLEGRKTIAYELAEAFNWVLPDAVLCPTANALSLVGLARGFQELRALGWCAGELPHLIAVQAQSCSPLTQVLAAGADAVEFPDDPFTLASELRVPEPRARSVLPVLLRGLRVTPATAADPEMFEWGLAAARSEGLLPALEGAACLAALPRLLAAGLLQPDQRIVVLNPAAGTGRTSPYTVRLRAHTPAETDKLGGLITPR